MIYLIRHGQASFGAADYDQLSELGAQQATLLGNWLARIGQSVDLVALGGMKRHRQTAEACLRGLGAGLTRQDDWWVDPGFDEFDHVEVLRRFRPELVDGNALARFLASQENPHRAFQELFAQAVARWRSGAHDEEYRESWRGFQSRCAEAFARLSEGIGAAQTVCVFTSGGPISTICQRLLGIADDRAFDLNWTLLNTGLTKVVTRPRSKGDPSGKLVTTLHSLNAVAHLELAGDSGLFTYR
jgi:broad specificity phosphatase PhoE